MVADKSKTQLPVLHEVISNLLHAATRLAPTAARELALAVQYDHRRDVDPYGNPQAPVRMTRSARGGMSRRYDANSTIAKSYYPVAVGTDAMIISQHRASRALQVKDPRNSRPGRRSHPDPGAGLGTWERRISRMNRRLLVGARMHYQLGDEGIAEIKAAAAARRQARFEARNLARIRIGLKPLAPRRVRADRARIDQLVERRLG